MEPARDQTPSEQYISPEYSLAKGKTEYSLEKDKTEHFLAKDKNVYDIVNLEELELLYKKNAHLLARLSKEGKENTRLYTELSALNKEKSSLGNKHTVLKSKYRGLKEQISLFARQHRAFNHQSHQLKKELSEIKKTQAQERSPRSLAPELLKKREKALHLFEKKEQVYIRQIQNLQNWRKQSEKERQSELKRLEEDVHKKNRLLEEQTQKLRQALSAEKDQSARRLSSHLQKTQTAHRDLSQKIKALKKELKIANSAHQAVLNAKDKAVEERQLLKDTLRKNVRELSLKDKELSRMEKAVLSFKNREKSLRERADKLKEMEQVILAEKKAIKSQKNKEQKLRAAQEDLLNGKNQIAELIKQKGQLKAGFAHQLNLFSKERDSLKFQCENFKKALAVGKMGFDQAMLSFQRKYIKLSHSQKELKKQIEGKTKQIQALEEQAVQSKKQQEEAENQIHLEKDKQLSQLRGQLAGVTEHNQRLEAQIQTLKAESEGILSREQKQRRAEIQNLMWDKDKALLSMEESHKAKLESLRADHDRQIQILESAGKKKIRHIQIEMENDLCSERKRHEIFKGLKDKQIKELSGSLSSMQEQNHELKTRKNVLEKSLAQTRENLDKYLKNSKKWESQNHNLKALWQDLQAQNEKKDLQIQSLQKLNRSLSLSLTQSKQKKPDAPAPLFPQQLSSDEDVKKDSPPSVNHVLADIHFD